MSVLIVVLFIFISYSAFSIWSFSNEVHLVKTDAAVVLGAAAWDDKTITCSSREDQSFYLAL